MGCCECLQPWIDRQTLRELPGPWRIAYLFFALAYMLILGTGEALKELKELQRGLLSRL